jgi:hypothetical protein
LYTDSSCCQSFSNSPVQPEFGQFGPAGVPTCQDHLEGNEALEVEVSRSAGSINIMGVAQWKNRKQSP